MSTNNRVSDSSADFSAALDIPIATRANDFLPALGELDATLQLGHTYTSPFGAFPTGTAAFDRALAGHPFDGGRSREQLTLALDLTIPFGPNR